MTTKMTTREITNSKLAMICISGSDADPGDGPKFEVLDRIMAAAKAAGGGGEPVYDVRIMICGIEVDFGAFEREVEHQMDKMVAAAAAEVYAEAINNRLLDSIHALTAQADRLRDEVEAEVERLAAKSRGR